MASGCKSCWIQRGDLEANRLSRYTRDEPQLIVGGGLAWENQVQEARSADACILERRLRRTRNIEQRWIVHIVDVDGQGAVDQSRRRIVHSRPFGLLVATGNTGVFDQDTHQNWSVDQVVVVGRWGIGDSIVDQGQRFTQTSVRDEFGIDDSEGLPRLVGVVDIPVGSGRPIRLGPIVGCKERAIPSDGLIFVDGCHIVDGDRCIVDRRDGDRHGCGPVAGHPWIGGQVDEGIGTEEVLFRCVDKGSIGRKRQVPMLWATDGLHSRLG